MDGQIVSVREVADFSDSRDDSINIVFTTIQKAPPRPEHATRKSPVVRAVQGHFGGHAGG
jgi:hypothetical protein